MGHDSGWKALYIIVNAGFADDVVEIARGAGVRGATILNARGGGERYESFLGITVDSEKDLVLCVTDAAAAERAMEAICREAGVRTPAHGVCFTMPVERSVGIDAPEEGPRTGPHP